MLNRNVIIFQYFEQMIYNESKWKAEKINWIYSCNLVQNKYICSVLWWHHYKFNSIDRKMEILEPQDNLQFIICIDLLAERFPRILWLHFMKIRLFWINFVKIKRVILYLMLVSGVVVACNDFCIQIVAKSNSISYSYFVNI